MIWCIFRQGLLCALRCPQLDEPVLGSRLGWMGGPPPLSVLLPWPVRGRGRVRGARPRPGGAFLRLRFRSYCPRSCGRFHHS